MEKLFKILLPKSAIDKQLDEFFCYKAYQSLPKAESYAEEIRALQKLINVKTIFDITQEDLDLFQQWVEDSYASEYRRKEALSAVNAFLRFFRCGIMMTMKKNGRPANVAAIELVQDYRAKGLSFREVSMLLKKKGFNSDLKVLHFWAHYPLEKLKLEKRLQKQVAN